ncbi:hypothetical protein ON010_g5105 [Phytophthora cinnamomi]|nr:hypothetical protein ON010_g5105 [Phytophthora cinnamomi]
MSWLGGRIHGVQVSPLEARIGQAGGNELVSAIIRPASHAKSLSSPTVEDVQRASRARKSSLTFAEAFGRLGLVIVLVVFVSIAWTVWLIILTVAPNETANYLTKTTEFDDGRFWLIIDPDPTFLTISTFSLGMLVLVYIDVVLKMSVQRNMIHPVRPFNFLINMMCPGRRSRSQIERNILAFWYELTAFNGIKRKYWNTVLKLPDLVIEILALCRLLEDGIPAPLCYAYACLISANSLSCAVFILKAEQHSALSEVFVDSFFDMVFAVGWPILWLVYSVEHFTFDRAKALLYLKVYPSGWYERKVRLMADAASVTLFQISFDALRMKSGSDLTLRMAMNLSFCYRLKRAVEFLIRRQRQALGRTKSFNLVRATRQSNLPRPTALVFLALSVGVLIATHMSIVTSENACTHYPQCVVHAYRWKKHESCPCRALIDEDQVPRTYEEWIHPPDVTNLVGNLAKSGDLRIIQIINRQLPVWPTELQWCTDLRSITLMYTGINIIPEWAATFHNLEMLSIEGRPIDNNLVSLPQNLFDGMQKLTYLHLAVHQNLVQLSRLDGLTNLKSLTLAIMMALEQIPRLDKLTKLQLLQVVGTTSTQRIPDLSPHVGSVSLIVVESQACCDGYIVCNPSHRLCSAHPACLDKNLPENRPNKVTQRIFDLITVKTCTTSAFTVTDFFKSPTKENVDNCGGVLYAQCQIFNGTANVAGMCYNERMQVVSCQTMPLYMAARKQEIQLGIGIPCDPVYEKWLGCTETSK